ncbi:MAG: hypothetical protein AAGG68_08910 [Bacteroidota bacterium]
MKNLKVLSLCLCASFLLFAFSKGSDSSGQYDSFINDKVEEKAPKPGFAGTVCTVNGKAGIQCSTGTGKCKEHDCEAVKMVILRKYFSDQEIDNWLDIDLSSRKSFLDEYLGN